MNNENNRKQNVDKRNCFTPALTMTLMFIVLICGPFIFSIVFNPLLDKIDYGKRNATYTYFYQREYVDTGEWFSETLAEFPEINIHNISKKPEQFEAWFNDRLPFKKLLKKLNSEINYYMFHQFTNSHVVAGKAGWLFYDEAVDESIGKWILTDEQLEYIAKKMQNTKDILHSEGKEFIIFIAPNKETVYSEYLPEYDKIRVDKTAVNQLIEYLRNNTDITVIYPLEDLLEAKDNYPEIEFYHRLDTHWNCAGAYIGAKALTKELGCELPDFSQIKYDEYDFTSSDLTNLAGMPMKQGTKDYSLYDYAEEPTVLDQWEYYDLIKYHNDNGNGNLVVFRDSFSSAMSQHLSVPFRQSIYPRFNADKQLIYEYDADIVVYELVERDIKSLWDMGLE